MNEDLKDAWDQKHESERFYGQVSVDGYPCALIKGQGKVPWDPAIHRGRRKSYAIDFTVAHVDPTWPLIQRTTVNFTRNFNEVTRPSIETLLPTIAKIKGLVEGQFPPLVGLDGLWVSGTLELKPDNKKGETFTCCRFDGVFPDEAACRAAYEADTGAEADGSPVADLPFEPEPPKPKADPIRATLAAFLPNLWEQAQEAAGPSGSDANLEMARLLKASPLLGQHFDVDSPEVVALMGGSA